MPSMGAIPGLPAVPPMPLPPLPPGVPGVGVSPPLVASVTPPVPSLANGAPAMIQPISGFSHPGNVNAHSHYPDQLMQFIYFGRIIYGCLSLSLSCCTQQNRFVQSFQYQATEGPVCRGTQVHTHTYMHTVFTDIS